MRGILREDQGGGQGKLDMAEEVIGWRGRGRYFRGCGAVIFNKSVQNTRAPLAAWLVSLQKPRVVA